MELPARGAIVPRHDAFHADAAGGRLAPPVARTPAAYPAPSRTRSGHFAAPPLVRRDRSRAAEPRDAAAPFAGARHSAAREEHTARRGRLRADVPRAAPG